MTIRSGEPCGCHVRRAAEYEYRLADGRVIEDMHPDDVAEVLGVFEAYAGSSMSAVDAMAHALVGFRACRERRAIQERAAARRQETAARIRAEYGSRLS